ncbi:MAG: DUF2085 domain-containing protein [Vicinamibacterales bacterium]
MTRAMAIALAAGAVLWGIVILTAPLATTHRSGARVATFVYAGASRICHQRSERSFAIAGVQMPVCARCSGLYLSGAVGALLAWAGRVRRPVSGTRPLVLIAAVPTAVTFSLEFLGVLPFSNAARAIAALPLGAVAGWLFVRMLRYDARFDGNQIVNR